ncbi:MAG: hypothetical protein J0L66_07375 [Cytophagales bacterium]|nr:hypothetical protein [Cytophagales bacterium]
MALIIDILRVSREIYYFINLLKKQSVADRQRLADTLLQASTVVKETFEKLSNGVFPVGCCQQLELLSHPLYFQLEGALGPEHAQNLADKFKQTHRVDLLHREFTTGTIDARELVLLDEAAEHFYSTSKLLLV